VTERTCGDCSLCCKVMGVEALQKAPGIWCQHARPGKGCVIHGDEAFPPSCGEFACAWLENEDLPLELKPTRVHAFLTGAKPEHNPLRADLLVHVDPAYPDAWRRKPLAGVIEKFLAAGQRVLVRCGRKGTLLQPLGAKGRAVQIVQQ
jgi:hypothetical protein